MKIALCLAGQLRTFETELVQKSLHKFLYSNYDCDIFISTWNKRGVSYCHGQISSSQALHKDEIITENGYKKLLPIKKWEIEIYDEWYNNLSYQQRQFIEQGGRHHAGCLPQLYKKYRVFKMLENSNQLYDYVIITRPDIFLWEYIDIQLYLKTQTIYTFNLPESFCYHPSRIYDIFFMGKYNSIEKVTQAYENVFNLLDDPYYSNLSANDCCKMLFIHAKKFCNLNVESVKSIPGELFRGNIHDELIHYSALKKNNTDFCCTPSTLLKSLDIII